VRQYGIKQTILDLMLNFEKANDEGRPHWAHVTDGDEVLVEFQLQAGRLELTSSSYPEIGIPGVLMRTKAKLTLHVTYEGPDADEATVRHLLQSLVEHASDRGLLTGEFDMTVEESVFEIEVSRSTS
jgi:hypothetical protein